MLQLTMIENQSDSQHDVVLLEKRTAHNPATQVIPQTIDV